MRCSLPSAALAALIAVTDLSIASSAFVERLLGRSSPIGSDQADGVPLKIAVAKSFEGPNAASARVVLRAAEKLVHEVHAGSGIDERSILLEPFEDRRTAEGAEFAAIAIGWSDDIIGVVGHGSSTASRSAGHIYRLYKMPVITPTSTIPHITLFNEWFFRTIFNDGGPASSFTTPRPRSASARSPRFI